MDMHMVTHIVMFAVLASLFKKYVQVLFQLDDLREKCVNNDEKHYDEVDLKEKEQKTGADEKQQFSSFGRCQASAFKRKICHFQNLCYEPSEDTFIFFNDLNEKSILFDKKELPYLSTPIGYNGNQFKLTFLPEVFSDNFKIKWINKTSYIFSRFKPDNIMHVLHDDIIPLFFTLQYFEGLKSNIDSPFERFDVKLIFMDKWSDGEYKNLYRLFTNIQPLHQEDLQKKRELVCYSESVVGLLADTLWYNYGFLEYQGPIKDSAVLASHIQSTAKYILQNLKRDGTSIESDYVIIISRKENRKILNENELIQKLSIELGMKVVVVSSETHTLSEIISLVAKCKGMMGMHGSLLILAMFLQPGSFLIEMFPYAVKASHYTPYKTLAEIPGMDILYKSWENMDMTKSVGHVEYPHEHGGLSHLTQSEQADIINQKTVPRHLCCDDPSWLYHIYQDTTVDIIAIVYLVEEAIKRGKDIISEKLLHDKSPTVVKNIKCNKNMVKTDQSCFLHILFQKPWNIQFLHFNKLHYEILLETEGVGDSKLYVVTKPELSLYDGINCNDTYIVWIRAVIDDVSFSEYVHEDCMA